MALSIKTEEADRLARELTRLTGETMTDAVTVVDSERHVVYANRAAAELLGAQNEYDVLNTTGPGLAAP